MVGDRLEELLKKHGKRCPKCSDYHLTTLNNEHPLMHRCLKCLHEFPDAQAIKSRNNGLTPGESAL
jgi:hypothetical protein